MDLHEHRGLECLDPQRFSADRLAQLDTRTIRSMLDKHRRSLLNISQTWSHLVPKWQAEITAMENVLAQRQAEEENAAVLRRR